MYAYQTKFPQIPVWALSLSAALLVVVLPGGQQLAPPTSGMLPRLLSGLSEWARVLLFPGAAGLSVLLLHRLLHLCAPGVRKHVSGPFLLLCWTACPTFLLAGANHFAVLPVLVFMLMALWPALRAFNTLQRGPAFLAAVLSGLAALADFHLAALFLPLLAALAFRFQRAGYWGEALVLFVLFAGVFGMGLWSGGMGSAFAMWYGEWSPAHYGQFGSGLWSVPNAVYMLFPFAHPAFCLLLPGFLLLSRPTDWGWEGKRALMAGAAVYMVWIGGMPGQYLSLLLSAYALILLLIFPAWDRFLTYGEFFFPRLAGSLLALLVLVQVGACVYWLMER